MEQTPPPHDPYAAPKVDTSAPLGSLAQAARGKELKGAQGILIVIGLLTLAVNGFLLYNLPNELKDAAAQQQVAAEDMDAFRQAVNFAGAMIYGIPALIGLLFIVFGVIIKTYPVPITTVSLALYVLSAIAFAFLDPTTLARGLVLKIIIVVALFRAWKAARAHEAEAKGTALGEFAS